MSFFEKLGQKLRLDASYDAFELLESESGTPGERQSGSAQSEDAAHPQTLAATLDENMQTLKGVFRADINRDIVFRSFVIGGRVRACAVFVNGMASGELINEYILKQCMRPGALANVTADLCARLASDVLALSEAEITGEFSKVIKNVLDGLTAVLVEGDARAVIVETRGYEKRSVSPPENEKIVRGPQEGFTENLRTNITLIRKIVRTADLVSEIRLLDTVNNLSCAIIYREGQTNPELVKEIKRRLAGVKVNFMLGEGMLEQLTEKHKYMPVGQVLNTERPDRAASYIMSGHVVLVCDGSPFACILPTTLFTLLTTPEDMYLRRPLGTISRAVRYFGTLCGVLLPGVFLAAVLYHPGIIPTDLLGSLSSSRQYIAIPLEVEVILLLLMFQLVREAGLRVPGGIGNTIGVVGGIILGQAAVEANIVSSLVLIVVALAGLGSFSIPDYSTQLAVIVFRLTLIILGTTMGFLGIALGVVLITAALANMKSYGMPFLSPAAPRTNRRGGVVIRGALSNDGDTQDPANMNESI